MPVIKKVVGQVDTKKVTCVGVRSTKNEYKWILVDMDGVDVEVYCERSLPVKGETVRLRMDEKNGWWVAYC